MLKMVVYKYCSHKKLILSLQFDVIFIYLFINLLFMYWDIWSFFWCWRCDAFVKLQVLNQKESNLLVAVMKIIGLGGKKCLLWTVDV